MPARLFAVSLSLCLALSSTASALGGVAVQVSGPVGATVVGPVSVAGSGAREISVITVGQDPGLALPVSEISVGAGIGQLDTPSALPVLNQVASSEVQPAAQESVPEVRLTAPDPAQRPAQPVENSGASAPAAPAKKAGAEVSFDPSAFDAAATARTSSLTADTRGTLIEIGEKSVAASAGDLQGATAVLASIFREDLGTGSPSAPARPAGEDAVVTVLAAAVPTAVVRPGLAPAPQSEAQLAEVAESVASDDLGQAAAAALDGVQSAPTPLTLVQTEYPYSFEILVSALATSGAALVPLGTFSVGLGLEAADSAASAGFLPGFGGGRKFVPASSSRPSRYASGYRTGGTAGPAARPIRTVSASAAPSGVSAQHGVRPPYRGLPLLRPTRGISAPSNRIPVPSPRPVGRPWPMPNSPSQPLPVGRP